MASSMKLSDGDKRNTTRPLNPCSVRMFKRSYPICVMALAIVLLRSRAIPKSPAGGTKAQTIRAMAKKNQCVRSSPERTAR